LVKNECIAPDLEGAAGLEGKTRPKEVMTIARSTNRCGLAYKSAEVAPSFAFRVHNIVSLVHTLLFGDICMDEGVDVMADIDGDPVIGEVDVHWHPTVPAGAQLNLFQYPLRLVLHITC